MAATAESASAGPRAALKRVLVVEDSYLVAMSIQKMIEDFGFRVVGPAPSAEDALRLLEESGCDAAVLDVNLGSGETAEPVALRLKARGIPFIFVTGYASPATLGEAFDRHPRLTKPFEPAELRAAFRDVLGLG
ncbi:MAG: response regulator [Phycisphaerales bacterium]|nr:response regulator [Phycisphaerales bacterium]